MPADMVKAFAAIPNLYFSFNGRSLGPKESRVCRLVPRHRLLVETDAPDQLCPQLKGILAHNEPAAVQIAVANVAVVLDLSYEELAAVTFANAQAALLQHAT